MMYSKANQLLDDIVTYEQLEQNALIWHNQLVHELVNKIETNYHQLSNELEALRDSIEAGNTQLINTLEGLTDRVTQRLGMITILLLTHFK